MCEHEKLKTIGDRLFCKICKQELPLEFLYGKKEEPDPDPPVTAENQIAVSDDPPVLTEDQIVSATDPTETAENPPVSAENPPENPSPDAEAENDKPERRQRKKAVKTAKEGGSSK